MYYRDMQYSVFDLALEKQQGHFLDSGPEICSRYFMSKVQSEQGRINIWKSVLDFGCIFLEKLSET